MVWQPVFHLITHCGHPSTVITEDLKHHLFTAAQSWVHYMTCVIWLLASMKDGLASSPCLSFCIHPTPVFLCILEHFFPRQGLSVCCPFCPKLSFPPSHNSFSPSKFPLKCFFLQEVFLDIYPPDTQSSMCFTILVFIKSWYLLQLNT